MNYILRILASADVLAIGAILGAVVMVFVVRSNPKIILSANAISRAFESLKKIK